MFNKKSQNFRKRVDRSNKIARWVITLGGFGVVLSILLIFFFLVYQSVPLSFSASIDKLFSWSVKSSSNQILLTGTDKYKDLVYLLYRDGKIEFRSIKDGIVTKIDSIPLRHGEKITSASKGNLEGDIFSCGTDSGRIINAGIKMNEIYERNQRTIKSSVIIKDEFNTAGNGEELNQVVRKLSYSRNEDGYEFWAWIDENRIPFLRIYDADEEKNYEFNLGEYTNESKITALEVSHNGEKLIAGNQKGELFWFDLSYYNEIYFEGKWTAAQSEVTSLCFLIGDNSLVVGDQSGEISLWFPVRGINDKFKFTKIHSFRNHPSAITKIEASPRNRNFLTVDSEGNLHLNYSTTALTEYVFKPFENPVRTLTFSPKADGIVLIDDERRIGIYALYDPHPETTLHTLFGKVWYEGYEEPEFVWQSTGGSSEFEPKFSLVPLIFGTLKGTLYSMLFSIPLALLAAVYVSQFAPKKLTRFVKPTIEIMAALPSVVIGFLAGLYLSPLFEKNLMAVFLIMLMLPVFSLMGIIIWRFIPEDRRLLFPKGAELIFLVPVILLSFWFSSALSGSVENILFQGDIKQWMYNVLGVTYDQRNSLVVGIAMGFAVVPIIFTIAEDALSNVPQSLTSAALALGASKWQTVIRVVVPAAAGGIFAAVMLGLGRAIGETMIVLMATGNTPIMDLSPFNGFRAMSAAIAVEIPEAPVGGTLYRILFLTALLLFIFTFFLNSIAAWIGDRLRKKYARF